MSAFCQLIASLLVLLSLIQTSAILSIQAAVLAVVFMLAAILQELRRSAKVAAPAKAQG